MENLVEFLVYKKNFLRRLGIVGLKKAHLEANPVINKNILDRMKARFGDHEKLTNTQRTLAQFYCQESLYSNPFQKLVSKTIFLILLPALIILFIFESFKSCKTIPCDVFVFEYGSIEYARSEFRSEHILAGAAGKNVGNYLGFNEISFLFRTIFSAPSYLLHPKLLVNILRWLTAYAWVVRYRTPNVIATFFEGTTSSSLLTEYLHRCDIKHYNFAHGEHFRFDCYSAYANFDKYVIWGKHFKNIQIEKQCRPEMFVLRAPQIFNKYFFDIRMQPKLNKKQITVLIHSGVEKGLDEYSHLLDLLANFDSDWSIILRPHPVDRASWPKVKTDLENDLRTMGKRIELIAEYPEAVSMKESVFKSSFFVGSASAALLEALLAGCKIVYLPGRIKNNDLIERHQNSENVFFCKINYDKTAFSHFFNSEFVKSDAENNKIKYLFEVENQEV